ncbi:retinitis pigmentosa 1-like 1 protein [Xenentodon cancila]
MSSHKRNFQCFNAVGGDGSHHSSLPFKHHTTRLPRIPQHGVAAHHELIDECCLCAEYRHAQAVEAVESQSLPLYHAHPPYHHYHPHQYVLTGPSRPEQAPLGHERHGHHHRHNKWVVLVKNSDPSFRRTIILHRRSLRSFGLFLEEVSDLMQFHIRKVYTQEGRKIDSIQSLLQCPGVLICVGREATHPSIMENFQKTFTDKLPKLNVKPHSTGCSDEHERLVTKKSVILPNVESDKKATKQSVSSDKSVPDGTDSPDVVDSCPPTNDCVKEDDIQKRVRVNKDGSLSMEMKVRFRLQNDETLHWSTKVRKTTGGTCEYIQGHNEPYFAQRIYSESENISADDAYVAQRYHRHMEEPHCPHCCSHCQDYDIWKNLKRILAHNGLSKDRGGKADSIQIK